jgi:hypothetical protein
MSGNSTACSSQWRLFCIHWTNQQCLTQHLSSLISCCCFCTPPPVASAAGHAPHAGPGKPEGQGE